MPQSETIKIIAVGDIHGAWNDSSELALQFLKPDLLCLLGDFGNEDVPLVKRLAALPHSMVAILGNHDAWFSLNASGRKRALRVAHMSALPNALPSPTAVADQLAALNEQHVGYTSTRFPDLGLSVVGGRPFSKGGPRWDDVADFYKEYYDIKSLEESAFKLMDTALDVSHSYPDDMCILLSHNGPTGLGETRFSPCGVDWQDVEGDYGDPDLEEALDMLRAQKSCPTLILFGHMHHTLKGGGLRNRISIKNNSIILNCAVVPRIRKTAQHFVEIMVKNGQVESANDIWVDIDEDGGCQEIARHSLIEQDNGCMRYLKSYSNEWVTIGSPLEASQSK